MASIQKRPWTSPDGTPNTKFTVRWHDAARKHRQETFRTKKEASAFKLKIETEIAALGFAATKTNATVGDFCEQHIRQEEMRMRDGRIGAARYHSVKSAIDACILPYVGNIRADKLSRQQIEDWYEDLCRKHGRNVGLKPAVARARIALLGRIYERAIERKELAENPIKPVERTLKGVISDPVRTFTVAEVQKLLDVLEGRSERQRHRVQAMLQCVVHIAAYCGLRKGEILALKTDTIDLDRRVIRVRASYCRRIGLKTTKTKAGIRDVPMAPHLAEMLGEFQRRWYIENDERLLFYTQKGPCYSSIDGTWRRALKRAGLASETTGAAIHFHALRHFAASWWIANGMPLADAARLLGHKSFDMTLQVYAHQVDPGAHRNAMIDRMAGLLRKPIEPIEGVAHRAITHDLRIGA